MTLTWCQGIITIKRNTVAQEAGPKLIIAGEPIPLEETPKIEIDASAIEGRKAEMERYLADYQDFVRSPETAIAEHPEVKIELTRTREAGRNATAIEETAEFITEANPKLAAGVEAARAKAAEQAAASEQSLEIAKLKAEISELNKVVQKSETLERFGAGHSFNRDETYAFVEKEVLAKEARIRALEGDKRMLEKNRELKRLKDEINELNRVVQESEGLEKFGEGFSFDKDQTYKAINDRVLENERRIRELEGSRALSRGGEAPVQAAESEQVRVEEAPQAPVSGPEVTPTETAAFPQVKAEGFKERDLTQAEKDHLLKSFEQENKEPNKWWGWVKERVKGIATFGFWEFHQAERFRSNKKSIAKDIATEGDKIEHTQNLSLEEALEEATTLRGIANGNGAENLTRDEYEMYSNEISNRKVEQNNARIDAMVTASSLALQDKLAKYRNEFGKVVVADEAIMTKFEGNLRTSLQELQDGEVVSSNKKFKKIITENLDPGYWHRYVYGALEMLLAGWGLKVAVAKFANSQWWLGKEATRQAIHGHDINLPNLNGPAAPTGDVPMHNTIWQTAKEWLQQHGVTHPSNKEIMDVSKQVAKDNGIGVNVWNIPGSPLDTHMMQGHLLKFAGGAKIATAIKVARLLGHIF